MPAAATADPDGARFVGGGVGDDGRLAVTGEDTWAIATRTAAPTMPIASSVAASHAKGPKIRLLARTAASFPSVAGLTP